MPQNKKVLFLFFYFITRRAVRAVHGACQALVRTNLAVCVALDFEEAVFALANGRRNLSVQSVTREAVRCVVDACRAPGIAHVTVSRHSVVEVAGSACTFRGS